MFLFALSFITLLCQLTMLAAAKTVSAFRQGFALWQKNITVIAADHMCRLRFFDLSASLIIL
jgi:hypothetical protein